MRRITPYQKSYCDYWPQSPKSSRFEFDLAATPRKRNTEDWRAVKFRELERGGLSGAQGIYRPVCPSCPTSEYCLPARINFSRFSMSASQEQKHSLFRDIADLSMKPAAQFDADVFHLYKRYVPARHGNTRTAMGQYTADEFMDVFGKNAWIISARLRDGHLLAASIVDQHGQDFCAEYQIYDPEWRKISPGIAMTLTIVNLMKAQQPEGHLYVGSWSPGSPKLGYKSQFHGTEIYRNGEWRLHEDAGPCAAPSRAPC